MEEKNSEERKGPGGFEFPGDLPGSDPGGGDPLFLGDFRIVRKIGSGGMAQVYEAVQVSLNRTVALKILPSSMSASEKMVLLFQREAEAAGRQHHPGIVTVHTAGQHGGIHYIAEELVPEGRTLAHALDERRREDVLPRGHYRWAAEIAAAVADALKHAHELKVLHRDVKPSNILLDADGTPKVTDFGLARVEDALSLSRTGELMGTPYYMSPEQAVSRRAGIDSRTDVYSLGVTLYEMLTLSKPFEGRTSHEVLQKVITAPPKDPRRLNYRVPRALALICLKAMEKEPDHRYATMAELAADLRRFIDCEPVHARPAPPARRVWKIARQHPAKSAAAAVAAAALVVLALYAVWSWSLIRAEERKADAVNAFLADLFVTPDPDLGGVETRVVDVLDAASARIAEVYDGDPATGAALHSAIGSTYEALGAFERALEEYDRALGKVAGDEGEDSHETIELKRSRAVVLIRLGRYAEAEPPLRAVIAAAERDGMKEDEGTLTARDALARVHWQTGRFDEADALYRDVLETRTRLLDSDDPLLLQSMSNLGAFLFDRGKLEEAEPLLSAVCATRRRVFGDEDTNTLQSMNNLACLYERWGDLPRAESLYRETIAIQSRILPAGHADLLATKNNLAMLLVVKGDRDEAIPLYREVLDGCSAALGAFHQDTLQTKNNLAVALHRAGDLASARNLFEETLQAVRASGDAVLPEATFWKANMVELLIDLEELTEAEALSREIVDERKRLHGADDRLTCDALTHLANVLFLQDRALDAVRVLQTGVQSTGTLPVGTVERMRLHEINARCLIAMRRYEEAESHALDFYLGAKTQKSAQEESALKLLVELYGGWEKPGKRAEYENLLRNTEKR